jgi:hypothetical protein
MQHPAEAREADVIKQPVEGEHYGESDEARRRAPHDLCEHEELGARYTHANQYCFHFSRPLRTAGSSLRFVLTCEGIGIRVPHVSIPVEVLICIEDTGQVGQAAELQGAVSPIVSPLSSQQPAVSRKLGWGEQRTHAARRQ